jgi:hypothetical protein
VHFSLADETLCAQVVRVGPPPANRARHSREDTRAEGRGRGSSYGLVGGVRVGVGEEVRLARQGQAGPISVGLSKPRAGRYRGRMLGAQIRFSAAQSF